MTLKLQYWNSDPDLPYSLKNFSHLREEVFFFPFTSLLDFVFRDLVSIVALFQEREAFTLEVQHV